MHLPFFHFLSGWLFKNIVNNLRAGHLRAILFAMGKYIQTQIELAGKGNTLQV
jgi:hypothetical protein